MAITVTAYPTDETRAKASAIGASAYLTKPLDVKNLMQTFISVLSQ
jgi:CheY-like chemotaxis protein